MPTTSLTALNAATEGVPVGCGSFTVNVSGTFVGTVAFERAAAPGETWQPIAKDSSGTALTFTAPSGDLAGSGVDQEPAALIRAKMSAYTSGTAVVRIGRP